MLPRATTLTSSGDSRECLVPATLGYGLWGGRPALPLPKALHPLASALAKPGMNSSEDEDVAERNGGSSCIPKLGLDWGATAG